MKRFFPLLLALPFAAGGAQTSTVEITEWTVPWEKTRPRDPFVDAGGRVWFVGQTGNYIAHLDQTSQCSQASPTVGV